MADIETWSDRAVFAFFDLFGLMLVLPMGDALYRGDSISFRMVFFAVVGFLSAIFGHSFSKIKSSARMPQTLRQSVVAVASDFRWWLVILLFGLTFLALPQHSPFDFEVPRYWIAVLVGAGVTALVFSILTVLQRATTSLAGAETQEIIARIQQVMVKPQIFYVRAPETLNEPSGNLYTHLRFRNRPSGRAAVDVEARIRWNTENGQELLALLGKWQEVRWNLGRAMYPANGINLAPDDREHALDLCIRKQNSSDFYAVDIQGAALQNSYAADCFLKSGIYKVFVKLSCDGYAAKFVFKVVLEGTNPPQIALIDGGA
jgi:hypothetical protein